MAKKAALSVRISATVKKGLDRAARADKRSTSALVEIILADYLAAAGRGKSKIPNPEEHLAAGGQAPDVPIPNKKTGRLHGRRARLWGNRQADEEGRASPQA